MVVKEDEKNVLHACDPHTNLVGCVDLVNTAPSHFVELGGSRAVQKEKRGIEGEALKH